MSTYTTPSPSVVDPTQQKKTPQGRSKRTEGFMRSDQYKNSIILDRSLVPGYRWPWALWGRSCAMHICSSTTTRLRPTLPRTKVEAAAFLCRLPSPCRPKTLGFLGFAPASSQQLAHSIYRTSSVNAAVRNLIFPPERFRARRQLLALSCLFDPLAQKPRNHPQRLRVVLIFSHELGPGLLQRASSTSGKKIASVGALLRSFRLLCGRVGLSGRCCSLLPRCMCYLHDLMRDFSGASKRTVDHPVPLHQLPTPCVAGHPTPLHAPSAGNSSCSAPAVLLPLRC